MGENENIPNILFEGRFILPLGSQFFVKTQILKVANLHLLFDSVERKMWFVVLLFLLICPFIFFL